MWRSNGWRKPAGLGLARRHRTPAAQIKLGLLLGTPSFRAECAWLEEGRLFTVQASQNYMDNEIGVFDCSVTDTTSGAEVAVAQLTVYQSDQIDHLLVAHQQSRQS